MAKESFLLVSLKGKKAKKLANVISNETSRKILDFLADRKKATESEISKELSIPMSTVHYNLKHLVDAKLVKADEFHYSEKGKEVNHYSLANKYIIIAPESSTADIRERIKSILPVALIATLTAGALQIYSKARIGMFNAVGDAAPMLTESVKAGGGGGGGIQKIAEEAAVDVATSASSFIAQNASESTAQAITTTAQSSCFQGFPTNFVLWFLIGTLFTIILFIFIEWIKSRKKE